MRSQPFIIGGLGLATLGEVVIDGPGSSGVLLAIFALLGWSQDRLMRRSPINP